MINPLWTAQVLLLHMAKITKKMIYLQTFDSKECFNDRSRSASNNNYYDSKIRDVMEVVIIDINEYEAEYSDDSTYVQ